jgi:hypothetical protein
LYIYNIGIKLPIPLPSFPSFPVRHVQIKCVTAYFDAVDSIAVRYFFEFVCDFCIGERTREDFPELWVGILPEFYKPKAFVPFPITEEEDAEKFYPSYLLRTYAPHPDVGSTTGGLPLQNTIYGQFA